MAAAKSRQKIPFWAMMALSLMPIWVFMYVRSLTRAPEVATGPLGVGAEVYGTCASCHGASGEGGVGRVFAGGEVLKTFPHIEDQLRFVYFGTANYNVAGVEIYGNPDREGGAYAAGSLGPMPAQGARRAATSRTTSSSPSCAMSATRSVARTRPARSTPTSSTPGAADDAPIFAEVESGTPLADLADAGLTDAAGDELMDIGDEPAAGSPPAE